MCAIRGEAMEATATTQSKIGLGEGGAGAAVGEMVHLTPGPEPSHKLEDQL